MSVGDEPLRIETPPPDGGVEYVVSELVFSDWHWSYNYPTLALWALIVLLLVAPKYNRHWQAWLILLPLGVLVGIWRLPALSLVMAPSIIENSSIVTEWCALTWSVVYLAAPWLATRTRPGTFFLNLAVMLIIGMISSYCLFLEMDADSLSFQLAYSLSVFVLLLAMMTASFVCRKNFTARRFLVLLMVTIWIVLTPMVFLWAMAISVAAPREITPFLLAVVPVTAIFGGVLYLLNLPFMVLAFQSPFYRARFDQLFRVGKDYCTENSVVKWKRLPCVSPLSTVPTAKPVAEGDVVGRWQFYLDCAARTVQLEFRPDGTYAQKILPNMGGIQELTGGSWKLEGPTVLITGYRAAVEDADPTRAWWMIDVPTGFAIYGGDGRDPQTFVCLQRR